MMARSPKAKENDKRQNNNDHDEDADSIVVAAAARASLAASSDKTPTANNDNNKVIKKTRKKAASSSSAWKERLTEQQLNHKRALDRQLVREHRQRSRDTIAQLEERVALLAAQQPERLVQQVLQADAALQRQCDAQRQRLHQVCAALGFGREDSDRAITALLPPLEPSSTSTSTVTAASTSTVTATAIATDTSSAKFPPLTITANDNANGHKHGDNAAMFGAGIPSPWPELSARMESRRFDRAADEDERLEAIVLWRRDCPHFPAHVFDLAAVLFSVDRAPANLTRERLRALTRAPGIMHTLVHHLEQHCLQPICLADMLSTATTYSDPTSPDASPSCPATATVCDMRKQLAICAFAAIAPWQCASRLGRLALFSAMYRILAVLVFPNPKNLARCPAWFSPLPLQMQHEHPTAIDLIPWWVSALLFVHL
jgi:hypothetical protein